MIQSARPAATVAVLRDSGHGIEVFLVKRNAKTEFFPHAHVFPGGRVDPEDADAVLVGGERDRVRMECPDAAAYQVAAIRETYEEAGILLAEGEGSPAIREAVHAGRISLGEAARREGWVLNAEALVYWSWWITPEVEKRRYSARFFVAAVEGGEQATHDRVETVDSEWMTPRKALRRFAEGELFLAPPTYRTLQELSAFDSVAAVLEAGRARTTPGIMPKLRPQTNGDLEVLLPGHPEHPDKGPVENPSSFVMDYSRFRKG